MNAPDPQRERTLPLCIGLTPFATPDTHLLGALAKTSALAVLDLGSDRTRAEEALQCASRMRRAFGVRLSQVTLDLALPESATWVILDKPRPCRQWRAQGRRVLVEVVDVAEAKDAISCGATALIAKGHEAAGRVGEETTFVLLQRLLETVDLPVYCQGGIAAHAAAAVVAAGATGFVIDVQLALLREARTRPELSRRLELMDGTETTLIGGHRVWRGPRQEQERDVGDVDTRLGDGSAPGQLIPLGQDAALAARLAERTDSVAALVRHLERSVVGKRQLAVELQPFRSGSAFARGNGLSYPVLQGPMTRVSDTPGFAASVAEAGGLPFVALALERGERARRLLEDTRSALGARPWGVGVLGFVDAETRREQFDLLTEIAPPFVLIAGGRPAQALELERAGVAAFVHVPSAQLLQAYLAEGVTRFVLEGRECGGHVGPRASSVLWESALEVLLRAPEPQHLSVVFAGGIHDARSAQIAAMFAAPLAARGMQVALLMGTAYLFTHEAVATGAITPAFQRVALECTETVTLESGPGHATRCAPTPFASYFGATQRQLQAEGAKAAEVRATLEGLNLGRLRLASKGIAREGEALHEVSEARQREQGLFMLGQVAALRAQLQTVDALHRSVCAPLKAADVPRRGAAAAVAIVGMAGVFPDADDPNELFANVLAGRNSITEVPAGRWPSTDAYAPEGGVGKTRSKWGGFIRPQQIDPSEFGIPPSALGKVDPAQLLALLVVKRALLDASVDLAQLDGETTSVILGTSGSADIGAAYTLRMLLPALLGTLPAALDAALPELTEDSYPGVLPNITAGRVANRLNLGGANYTVDAACASSLSALDNACKELAAGTSDLVVAGGVDIHNSLVDYLLFSSVGALSPTGQCRTFSNAADGIALGEAVAAVVLKRLDDAVADGDRIYAVVRGVGASSDGRALGLTAPRRSGQELALQRAYRQAGVSMAAVGLLEAHGTGTVRGDATELRALSDFADDSGAKSGACTLGSIKSQIGHTKCAAGMAGLIKAALSIYHGVLPPTLNIEVPNDAYLPRQSPFVFRSQPAPWLSSRRTAGVSAFGFGGTNFHAVLSAAPNPRPCAPRRWPAELVLLRADSDEAARAHAASLLQMLAHPELELASIALTASRMQAGSPVQYACVVESREQLAERLRAICAGNVGRDVLRRQDHGHHGPGQLAFLFPGQGSQYLHMAAELAVHWPSFRARFQAHPELCERVFPPNGFERGELQTRALTDTATAQPLLGLTSLAFAELLHACGVRPDAAAGHSYGEISALAYAGALPADRIVALSEARAAAMLAHAGDDAGAMAAVFADVDAVRDALAEGAGCVIANVNSPSETVIAGTSESIARCLEVLADKGLRARRLAVSAAFHSPLMRGADDTFREALSEFCVAEPTLPVWSNVTAERHAHDPEQLRERLAQQLVSPVQFARQIEDMYRAGVRTFVELGPGQVLTGNVARILGERSHLAVALDRKGGSGVRSLLSALAQLAAAGVPVDVEPLFAERAVVVSAPPAPRAPGGWLVDGQYARPVEGDLPAASYRPLAALAEPVLATQAGLTSQDMSSPEQVLMRHMQAMQDMIALQRDVMLGYLGTSPSAQPASVTLPSAPARGEGRAAQPLEARTSEEVSSVSSGAPSPRARLLQLLETKTGYPQAMLDPDADLEGDLGVDSIKLAEIVASLEDELGLSGLLERAQSGGAGPLTLARLSACAQTALSERAAESVAPAAPEAPPDVPSAPSGRVQVERLVPMLVPHDPPMRSLDATHAPLTKQVQVAATNGPLADELCAALQLRGYDARVVASTGESALLKGSALVFLGALDPQELAPAKALLPLIQKALRDDVAAVFGVTAFGGGLGIDANANAQVAPASRGGLGGLLKAAQLEHPELTLRAIDVESSIAAPTLAEHIHHELVAPSDYPAVGYQAGERLREVLRSQSLRRSARLSLDEQSVVLLSGGARGITAEVALCLATRFGCRIELLGRTPVPSTPEPPALSACRDRRALMRALLSELPEGTTPADLRARCAQIEAVREVQKTLAALSAAGSTVRYHALDVRNAQEMAALMQDIVARHGRLDGIIHGAGVIEDRRLRDKRLASFERVYDTKVDGARALLTALPDGVRFVAFFSSVASVYGSPGQADYAAANDVLDKLAWTEVREHGPRLLSVNWGPWAGAGMVTPALERSFQARGIALLEPHAAANAFVDELLCGSDPQVVLRASAQELRA